MNRAQLALMDWLTEAGPGRRIMRTSPFGIHLFEVVDRDGGKPGLDRVYPSETTGRQASEAERALLVRLGGRDKIDTMPMYRGGFFDVYHPLQGHAPGGPEAYERFAARFDSPYVSGSGGSFYEPTETAFAFMAAQGRDQLAALVAREEAEREAVARTVLVGRSTVLRGEIPEDLARQVPAGMVLPVPSRRVTLPYATATVVRETAARLYVRDVRMVWDRPVHFSGPYPFSGHDPNMYVSPEDVIVDDPAPGLVERLVEIEADYHADLHRITADIVRQMLPLATEMYSRLLQKDSEREDLLREAISEARDEARAKGPVR